MLSTTASHVKIRRLGGEEYGYLSSKKQPWFPDVEVYFFLYSKGKGKETLKRAEEKHC